MKPIDSSPLDLKTFIVSIKEQMGSAPPFIQDDTVVFGILMALLGLVFYTSSIKKGFWGVFYKVLPALFVCYFLPSILGTMNIINAEFSGIYYVASRYLLPASLLLMTLSIDIKGIFNLGPKSLIMFGTATVGIMFGGPIAVWIMSHINPEVVGGSGNEAAWRGLSTLAGSWIGGGANQAAMLEVYQYPERLFSSMVTVDIIVANIWMALLLIGVGRAAKIDKWLKADNTAIDDLIDRMQNFEKKVSRNPSLVDYMKIGGVAFAGIAFAHYFGGWIADSYAESIARMSQGMNFTQAKNSSVLASDFFWLVVISTLIGFVLSFTKARRLEGAGASKIGSLFIYILVASIGMKMDILLAFQEPSLFLVGLIWMAFHVGLLIIVAKIIRAPYFFLAVGSKANVGGAASAPVVASAFHPSLTTVGVLLAVLGYFLGTYGAIACAEMMHLVAP